MQKDTSQLNFEAVVEYVYNNKEKSPYKYFSLQSIERTISQKINDNSIRAFFDGEGRCKGAVIFNRNWRCSGGPNNQPTIYINQIWCDHREDFILFLLALRREFPTVSSVWGKRRGKLVRFNLTTLEKIYGRSSCTRN